MIQRAALLGVLLAALPGWVAAQSAEPVIEENTGIDREAIVALSLPGDEPVFTLYYLADRVPPTQVRAVPVTLCRTLGLRPAEVEDEPLDGSTGIANGRRLFVRCQ